MTHADPAAARSGDAACPKPWQRPRILSREPLEAVAAACVPAPPGKPDSIQCGQPTS